MKKIMAVMMLAVISTSMVACGKPSSEDSKRIQENFDKKQSSPNSN